MTTKRVSARKKNPKTGRSVPVPKPYKEPTIAIPITDVEVLRSLAQSATTAILDGGDASVLLALRSLRGIDRSLGIRIAAAGEVTK